NAGTWSFVRGPSKGGSGTNTLIPPDSVLGRWRLAAADPGRKDEAVKLARQVEALLSGPRSAEGADSGLYDKLGAMDGPLFTGVDVARLAKPRPKKTSYGLAKARYGSRPGGKPIDDASLVAAADSVTPVRLPAALFRDRVFVVEGQLDTPPGNRVV